jgi:hypothetical protein
MEWKEFLMPSLRLGIFNKSLQRFQIIERGHLVNINFAKNTVEYKEMGKQVIQRHDFIDVILMDDENGLQKQRTIFLSQLHEELFKN